MQGFGSAFRTEDGEVLDAHKDELKEVLARPSEPA